MKNPRNILNILDHFKLKAERGLHLKSIKVLEAISLESAVVVTEELNQTKKYLNAVVQLKEELSASIKVRIHCNKKDIY